MTLIDCIEISKQFGQKLVLNEASFSAKEGEKIALIGKNGQGKSTLLKLISGALQPDSGRVIKAKNARLGILEQSCEANLALSLHEHIKSQLKEHIQALKDYEHTSALLAQNPTEASLSAELARLANLIDSLDAWDLEHKIKRAFKELDLERLANRPLASLSGGELRRANLCAMLLLEPDLMILDEPTNHLDINMCEYLISMLKASKKCIIVVSHDRYLIDQVAQRCAELENGKIYNYEGNYADYLARKQERLASMAKSHQTLLKQLKSEEEWLRRGVKARLKRNEGRKERLMQMRQLAKQNPSIINNLKVELLRALPKSQTAQAGTNRKKMLFEIDKISLNLGDKELFKDFSTRILQGEKIAIVGKNGCGKSSFLRLLLGELEPSFGQIKRAKITVGYFDQSRQLPNDATLIEYFCPNGGDIISVRGQNMHVFGYLKKFLFPKEQLGFKIGSLSGGERARIALAKLFTQDYELLILDEPTNDLDIATINILEEYLQSYKGALIFVSHDRYFTDRLAHKLYAIDNHKISIEHMSFSELAALNSELAQLKDEINKDSKPTEASVIKERSRKLSYKEQQILNHHPNLIEEIQSQINAINARLAKANNDELAQLCKLLDETNLEYERLQDEYLNVLMLQEELSVERTL